jgi:hypothetical protein
MFTQAVVDQIPEAPKWVPIRLEMKWEFATSIASKPTP